MNCSRQSNSKINKIQERALRMIHKTKMGLNPPFMRDIFVEKTECKYNMRSEQHLALPRTKTSKYGLGSLKYMGYKTWNNIPMTIKKLDDLPSFKIGIKTWKGEIANVSSAKCTSLIFGYI